MNEINEGSKEDINQKFKNNIEFFRFEFNDGLHMIRDESKRKLLLTKLKQNRQVNPITNRKIKKNGDSYHRLARLTGLVFTARDLEADKFAVVMTEPAEKLSKDKYIYCMRAPIYV